jgi:hypothetical protein
MPKSLGLVSPSGMGGSPAVTERLRAERSGMGEGRRYTLTYIADDVAEIVACTTTVIVLH